MRLADRKPGTVTMFCDSSSGEDILGVGADGTGRRCIFYQLYDSKGNLVAATDGFEDLSVPLTVTSRAGEVLLDVPSDPEQPIRYCLYSPTGGMLTWSDGERTKVYGTLRMDGSGHGWTPPKTTLETAGS